MADNSKKNNRLIKLMIGSVVAVLVAALAFGVVFAYLSGKTGSVKNDMTADGDPIPTIIETFEPSSGLKQNVAVSVDVDYECYVRATIVVNWVSADGKTVYSERPTFEDVAFTVNDRPDGDEDLAYWVWDPEYDFFYYTVPVKGGATEPLIIECRQTVPAPEGYKLNVQVVAQTIQASGWSDADNTLAVVSEWGVVIDDEGTLSLPAAAEPSP